jgi:charged multivesicular body protein 4
MSYFTGRKDNRQSARDSIVSLRQQLLTLDKREEFLQKKIEEELKKAKLNATSNKKRECRVMPRFDFGQFGGSAVSVSTRREHTYWHLPPITVAMAALRQKQAFEGELNRIAGTRLTLEAQVRFASPYPTETFVVDSLGN